MTAAVLEQVQEVVRLEQHVAELGVGDPLLPPLEASAHRLLGHHHVDRDVLADIAQELHEAEVAQPVGVVQQKGAVRAEVEEPLELTPNCLGVGRDLLLGEQRSLDVLAAGVADQRRPAAHHDDGPVAGLLEAADGHDPHELADVEAVGGGVEAAVERHTFALQPFAQILGRPHAESGHVHRSAPYPRDN